MWRDTFETPVPQLSLSPAELLRMADVYYFEREYEAAQRMSSINMRRANSAAGAESEDLGRLTALERGRAFLAQAAELGGDPTVSAVAREQFRMRYIASGEGERGTNFMRRADKVYFQMLAANSASPSNRFYLGLFHELRSLGGRRASQATSEAESWNNYSSAASDGYLPAIVAVGLCQASGVGTSEDKRAARASYAKAANRGNAQAKFLLGTFLFNGTGGAKYVGKAAELWQESARDGNANALCALGRLAELGTLTAPSHSLAFAKYQEAAAIGLPAAQFNLSVCLSRGEGCTPDPRASLVWLALAAENGHEAAVSRLLSHVSFGAHSQLHHEQSDVSRWLQSLHRQLATLEGVSSQIAIPDISAPVAPLVDIPSSIANLSNSHASMRMNVTPLSFAASVSVGELKKKSFLAVGFDSRTEGQLFMQTELNRYADVIGIDSYSQCIQSLIGASLESPSSTIFFELFTCTLAEVISDPNPTALAYVACTELSLSLDLAEAIHFLHSLSPPIVWGLSASLESCCIGVDGRLRIFGLQKSEKAASGLVSLASPAKTNTIHSRYIPSGALHLSTFTDIFAVGVMLSEIWLQRELSTTDELNQGLAELEAANPFVSLLVRSCFFEELARPSAAWIVTCLKARLPLLLEEFPLHLVARSDDVFQWAVDQEKNGYLLALDQSQRLLLFRSGQPMIELENCEALPLSDLGKRVRSLVGEQARPIWTLVRSVQNYMSLLHADVSSQAEQEEFIDISAAGCLDYPLVSGLCAALKRRQVEDVVADFSKLGPFPSPLAYSRSVYTKLFAAIRASHLYMLRLSSCGLEDGDIRVLVDCLSVAKTINTLVLHDQRFGAAACTHLGRLLGEGFKLGMLNLSNNAVGTSGAAFLLAKIEENHTLFCLSLDYCNVNVHQCLPVIFAKLRMISELDLSGNFWGSALDGFSFSCSLQALLLMNMHVRHEEGVELFLGSVVSACPRLVSIDIRGLVAERELSMQQLLDPFTASRILTRVLYDSSANIRTQVALRKQMESNRESGHALLDAVKRQDVKAIESLIKVSSAHYRDDMENLSPLVVAHQSKLWKSFGALLAFSWKDQGSSDKRAFELNSKEKEMALDYLQQARSGNELTLPDYFPELDPKVWSLFLPASFSLSVFLSRVTVLRIHVSSVAKYLQLERFPSLLRLRINGFGESNSDGGYFPSPAQTAPPSSSSMLSPSSISSIRIERCNYIPISSFELKYFPQLTELYMNECNFPRPLPVADFTLFTHLKKIVLSGTRVLIDGQIESLAHLSLLDLSNCQVEEVPVELANIGTLKRLFLHDNRLSHFPEEIGAAAQIERLTVHGNPELKPANIFAKSTSRAALRKHCEEILKDGQTRNSFKLVLLGQEAVGKTSIVRAMQAWRGTAAQRSMTMRKHGGERRVAKLFSSSKKPTSTDGVDIGRLKLPLPMNLSPAAAQRLPNDLTKLVANVYDFAGQQVYMSTHSLFLSPQTVYCVVFNAAVQETQSRVEYWLDCLRSIVGKNAIATIQLLLVGTFVDAVPESDGRSVPEATVARLVHKFGERYGVTAESIVGVSCATGAGFDAFAAALAHKALALKGVVGLRLPRSWVQFERALGSAFDSKFPVVAYDGEWQRAARRQRLIGNALFNCSSLLSALGVVSWRPEIPGLRKWIITQPSWLATLLSSIISQKTVWIADGTLSYGELVQRSPEWSALYPRPLHAMLLGFLGRLGLIIALNSSAHEALRVGMSGASGDSSTAASSSKALDVNARFLVPSLLFACSRKGCDGFLRPDNGGRCTRFDDARIHCLETRAPLPSLAHKCKNLSNTLRRIYTLKFVPRDLFGRVAAHLLANEFPGVSVQAGWIKVKLADAGGERKNKLFMVLREETRSWEVTSIGAEPERLFRFAISSLLTVFEFYRDLEYDTVIVCPQCAAKKSRELHDSSEATSQPSGTLSRSRGLSGLAASAHQVASAVSLSSSGNSSPVLRPASPHSIRSSSGSAGALPARRRGCISFEAAFSAWMGREDAVSCERSKSTLSLRVALPDIARSDISECSEGAGLVIDRAAKLGDGAFGTVYRGSLHHQPVAIKQLTGVQDLSTGVLNEYIHEIEMMASSLSPFLVRLLAIGSSLTGEPVLVTELLEGGTLWHRLRRQRKAGSEIDSASPPSSSDYSMDWKMRARIATDICQGLACLHGCNVIKSTTDDNNSNSTNNSHVTAKPSLNNRRPIAHRDLRSPNILLVHRSDNVEAPVVAKLADFGLSARVITEIHADAGDRPPDYEPRWLAPEVMSGQSHDERVDLYSLGIVLWELAAAPAIPFDPGQNEWQFMSAIEEAIKQGQRPSKPSWEDMKQAAAAAAGKSAATASDECMVIDLFAELSSALWNHEPDERPGAAVCAQRLDQLCDQLHIKPVDDVDWQRFDRSIAAVAAAADDDEQHSESVMIQRVVDEVGGLDLEQHEPGHKLGSLTWTGHIRQTEMRALDRFYSTRGGVEEFSMLAATKPTTVTGSRRVQQHVEGAEAAARLVRDLFNRQTRHRSYEILSSQACVTPRCLARFYARLVELRAAEEADRCPRVDLLFHYCAPQLLPTLCQSGPSSFYARGGWFGAGIYFSTLPEYALQGYAYREWRAFDRVTENELCRLAVRFRSTVAREAYVFREGSDCLQVEPWRRLRLGNTGDDEQKSGLVELTLGWDTGDQSGWREHALDSSVEPSADEVVIVPVRRSMTESDAADHETRVKHGFALDSEVQRDVRELAATPDSKERVEKFTIWAVKEDRSENKEAGDGDAALGDADRPPRFAAVVLEILYNEQGKAAAGRYLIDALGKKNLADTDAVFEHRCAPWKKVAPWMRIRVSGSDTAVLWPCSGVELSSDVWPFRTLLSKSALAAAASDADSAGGGLRTVPSMLQSLQLHSMVSNASSEASSGTDLAVTDSEQEEGSNVQRLLSQLDLAIDSEADDRLLGHPDRDDWRCRALACLVICGSSKAVRRRFMQDQLCSAAVPNGCGGPAEGHLTHEVASEEEQPPQLRSRQLSAPHDSQQRSRSSSSSSRHRSDATREIVVPVRERDAEGMDWSCDSQVLPRFVLEFGPYSKSILTTAGQGDVYK